MGGREGSEGWLQVPLAPRSQVLQAGRQLTSTSLRSSRTMTPHHRTRCVTCSRLASAPLLTQKHEAQIASFQCLLIPTHARRAEEFVRWLVNLCTITGRSWFPAAASVLLWGQLFYQFSGSHTCVGSSAFPFSHDGAAALSLHRILLDSGVCSCARVLGLNAFLQESARRRMERRKRAKGCRILNHTLRVSQPDVQRERCMRLS